MAQFSVCYARSGWRVEEDWLSIHLNQRAEPDMEKTSALDRDHSTSELQKRVVFFLSAYMSRTSI